MFGLYIPMTSQFWLFSASDFFHRTRLSSSDQKQPSNNKSPFPHMISSWICKWEFCNQLQPGLEVPKLSTVLLILKLAACHTLSPCPRCDIPSFSSLLCLKGFKPKFSASKEEHIESLGYLLYRKRHKKSEDSKKTIKTGPVLPNRSGTLTGDFKHIYILQEGDAFFSPPAYKVRNFLFLF